MKTISQYQPLIWGEIAERQSRRMAAEARVQRAVNVAVERLMLPLVAVLSAVVILSIAGELLLAAIHLVVSR